jgi:excisionase family DNA binding protein
MEQLLTPEEVAKILGMSLRTVRTWIYSRKLAHVKIYGKAVRVRASEVEKIVANGERPSIGGNGKGSVA